MEIGDILHQLSDFAGAPPCKVGKAVNLYYDRSSRAPSAAASGKRPATASIFEPRQWGDSYWGYEATIIRATKAQIKGIFLLMYYLYIYT